MAASLGQIVVVVREFLATELGLSGTAAAFGEDRPLISSGMLDSIIIARLVTFLEGEFPIEFMAYELDVDYLDTVALIAGTVHGKLEQKG